METLANHCKKEDKENINILSEIAIKNQKRMEFEMNQGKTRSTSLKLLHSFSSSAINVKKTKDKYLHEMSKFPRINFKEYDSNFYKNVGNINKKTNKMARGVLFLSKKRKFFLNYLFLRNESNKNKQKPGKRSFCSVSTSTKNSIPIVSKSLDNILLFNSLFQDEIQNSISRQNLIKKSLEGQKSPDKNDYDMVILFLSDKNREEVSCSQTNNNEVIDELYSHPEFSKKGSYKILEENIKDSHIEECDRIEEKIKSSERLFLHSSEAVSNIPKLSSSEYLNQPLFNKREIDLKAISETFKRTEKSPLCSLLSFFNSTLSTAASSSSDKGADLQTSSSGPVFPSVVSRHNKQTTLIDMDKRIDKVTTASNLEDELSTHVKIHPSNIRDVYTSKVDPTYVENKNFKNQLPQSVLPFASKLPSYVTKLIIDEENTEKSVTAKKQPKNKSLFSNNENIKIKPTVDSVCCTEISPDKISKHQQQNLPHFLLNKNDDTQFTEEKSAPLIEKEEYFSIKQPYIATNTHKYTTQHDKYNEELIKNYSINENKQTEDAFFSSFKKQYIPVPKSTRDCNESSVKSGETQAPFELTTKKSFDTLIENMSLTNNYLPQNSEIQDSHQVKQLPIINDRIYTNRDNRISPALGSRNNNETVSFFQDFHMNLQNSYPKGNTVRHYTEVLNNKTVQKSFQYAAESLKFELQFLDTIYTQRLQQAKKLTQESSKDYDIKQTEKNKAYFFDQIPVAINNQYKNKPESPSFYKRNTKVNYFEVEHNDSNKEITEANSLPPDYSIFSQPLNNCGSETNSKWSYDSIQSSSEFNALLSKEFKRDYIPVKGQRIKLNDADEQISIALNNKNNDCCEEEKHQIICNVEVSHQEKNNEYFNQNKKNEIVLNIILQRHDQNDSNLSFNLNNTGEDKLNKHSSKISVCISQESSDEMQEDEYLNDEEEDAFLNSDYTKVRERSTILNEFPWQRIPEQRLLLSNTNNSNLKSEIPECKTELFSRIYSDFSTENKSNPITYKYSLPLNQP